MPHTIYHTRSIKISVTPKQIQEHLDENRAHDCESFGKDHVCVRIASIAELPSRFGQFQVVAFYNNVDDKDHAAFVHGDVSGAVKERPIRMA